MYNIYIYIYIYIYLLTYYQPAFTVTRKKEKKTPGTRDKNISNHRLGKKEKISYKKKKKEKANSVTPVEKNQEICSQLVKRKIKSTVKRCNATITRVLNTNGANHKIKSRVGILLLTFHLNGSSGSLAPTDNKGENTIFYIHQKPTQLKIYITKEKINK